MHRTAVHAGRRRCLAALGAWCAAPASRAETRPTAPAVALLGDDGQRQSLAQRLRGRATAVQLMFTGCNGSCPMQGALFGAVAEHGLPRGARLLSISIDALGDSPATLRRWLNQFGAHPDWSAAVPAMDDVEPLSAWLKGRFGKPGTHTAQVFVFDRDATLRWRSGELPPAHEVSAWLAQLAG